jgi:hypothetical protein
MELIDMSGAARLVLRPVRYEHEKTIGDEWDDNWLVIAGEAEFEGRDWSFQEPILLVDEATEIANWLERVAARVEALTAADRIGTDDDSLAFIEPNLAFSLLRYGHATAIIQVHFSLESRPPDDSGGEDYFSDHPFSVEMEITLAAAAGAARIWRKQISAYPLR